MALGEVNGFLGGVWERLCSLSHTVFDGVATYYGLDDDDEEGGIPFPNGTAVATTDLVELNATVLEPSRNQFDPDHFFADEGGDGYVPYRDINTGPFGRIRVILDCRMWLDALAEVEEKEGIPVQISGQTFPELSRRIITLLESEVETDSIVNVDNLASQYVEECTAPSSDHWRQEVRWHIRTGLKRVAAAISGQQQLVEESLELQTSWEEVEKLPTLDRFWREIVRLDDRRVLVVPGRDGERLGFARMLAFRDPRQWEEPNRFKPRRHLTEGLDLNFSSLLCVSASDRKEVEMVVKSFLLHFLLVYRISPTDSPDHLRVSLRGRS